MENENMSSEIDVDQLITRIRAEAAKLADDLPEPMPLGTELGLVPRNEGLPFRETYHLFELLSLQEEAFVAGAYRALLRREADAEGSAHYLHELRAGRAKLEILCALRASREGREQHIRVQGLEPARLLFAVTRLMGQCGLGRIGRGLMRRYGRLAERRYRRQADRRYGLVQPLLKPVFDEQRRRAEAQIADHRKLQRELDDVIEQLRRDVNQDTEDQRKVMEGLRQDMEGLRQDTEGLRQDTESQRHVMEGQRQVMEGLRQDMEGLRQDMEGLRQDTEGLRQDTEGLRQDTEGLRHVMEGQRQDMEGLRQNFSEKFDGQKSELAELKAEFRQLHAEAQRVSQDMHNLDARRQEFEEGKRDLQLLRRDVLSLYDMIERIPSRLKEESAASSPGIAARLQAYYVAFEDFHRGEEAELRQKLAPYLQWFAPYRESSRQHAVLDVGCGRGEWLRLLAENGFTAYGLDANPLMAQECRRRGLEVVEADLLPHLRGLPSGSLSGLTGFHIVEHLPFEVLFALFAEAYRVLVEGGIMAFETPNPENVLVGSHTFYHDFTHRNPITPSSLAFLARYHNFERIRIERLNPYPEQAKVPGNDPLTERVNGHFCGPQDFALIAYKPRLRQA
jgi:SAM-dependent methyltransferase/uncharacterized protein YoxC